MRCCIRYASWIAGWLLLPLAGVWGQGLQDWPEFGTTVQSVEAHVRFLASDALAGRHTGSPGCEVAATYIAAQFESYGIAPVPGQRGYRQAVPLRRVAPPVSATLGWKKQSWQQGTDLLVIAGEAAQGEAVAVFAKYGWVDTATGADDYAGLDVQGKIVVVSQGLDRPLSNAELFQVSAHKRALAAERGAVALVERYTLPAPWPMVQSMLGRSRIELMADTAVAQPLLHLWYNDPEGTLEAALAHDKATLHYACSGQRIGQLHSANIMAYIPGSDSLLRDECIALTAHYDHVGIGRPDPSGDSIYNGARDNALGVAALLTAARSLAQQPPRRSVLLVAFTGEEEGMLGSRYFADHAPLPLHQIVYALNTDGAGYNDTTAVSAVGLDHVEGSEELTRAAQTFGLRLLPDFAPEQHLFERSDNVALARKGIPAPNLSPGITDFDEEINHYYHRPADEAGSLHYGYVRRYCQTYAYAARLIASRSTRLRWRPGDPYEEAARRLYGDTYDAH